MTKKELDKCENLCLDAIYHIEESNKLYKEHDAKTNDNYAVATVELRKADNKRGYAEGINQVLAILGYRSENMTKLTKIL